MRNLRLRPPLTACSYPGLLLILTIVMADPAKAQDANYWSSGYGPGSFFTPGGTIANNGDSGVFFYNPALLAWSHKNSATISGTIG
jgi:hypothetical protein